MSEFTLRPPVAQDSLKPINICWMNKGIKESKNGPYSIGIFFNLFFAFVNGHKLPNQKQNNSHCLPARSLDSRTFSRENIYSPMHTLPKFSSSGVVIFPIA